MEELVRKHYKKHVNLLWQFIGIFIILALIATSSNNIWVILFIIFAIFGIIYVAKELAYYSEHFVNTNNHLLNWKYANGDQLIITRWGLIHKISSPPELSVSYKFEGISWELDNIKGIAEVLIKNEGNLFLSMLPNVNYSTTTNQIDEFIPFSVTDKVRLIFFDYGSGVLIINIDKKDKKYTITLPLEDKLIEDEAFNCAKKLISRITPVEIIYIENDMVSDMLAEN